MTERDQPPERDVHHELNQPATDPDPTEWPDPYDRRPDPRYPSEGDPQRGASSDGRAQHERTAPR